MCFTGSISQNEVYKILAKSKLLVSANEERAYGMVTLEVITFNTPILAHEVGRVSEISEKEVHSYFENKFLMNNTNLNKRVELILEK